MIYFIVGVGVGYVLGNQDVKDYLGDKFEIIQSFFVNLYKDLTGKW